MKKINILLILILCMTGCKKEADTTSITGEIKGLGNDTIYLYGVDGLYEQIDTICVKGRQVLSFPQNRYHYFCCIII